MSRYGDRRRGMRRPQGNQTQDEFSKFRNDQGSGGSRRWDLSPSYREQFGHQVISNSSSYGRSDSNPNRYQYYSGREDYPGPSRYQGLRRDDRDWNRQGDWNRVNNENDWNYRDRGYYQPDLEDMSEYGYGSGTTEMPGRTWDQRGDESYNWGQHSNNEWSKSGQHRGKGPKGYKRLDERIREEINDALWEDEQLDASEVIVSVQDGDVSLSGTVCDRASKRRAEDLVEDISGVKNVENRIRIGVVAPEEPISQESRENANGRSRRLQES
jgi:osmotically-inducible protein OsmY